MARSKSKRCVYPIPGRGFRRKAFRLWVAFLLSFLLTIGALPAFSQVPQPQASSAMDWIDEGRTLYSNGHFREAIALWQQAATTYEQQRDDLHRAMALTYLSLAYQQLEQWSPAEAAIATSLSLLESVRSTTAPSESSSLYAQALNAQGRMQFTLGQTDQALATWQQATHLYEQIGDDTGRTGSLMNQAQAMEALGFYRRSCETLLTALDMANPCDVSLADSLEAVLHALREQADPQIQLLGLRNLGNVLRLMGNLDQARALLEQSWAIAQHTSSTQARGVTLLSLGHVERALYDRSRSLYDRTGLDRDRETADNHFRQALQYYRQVTDLNASGVTAETLSIQAQLQQLSVLMDEVQWLGPDESFASRMATIQAVLDAVKDSSLSSLPPSRSTVYAQLGYAQNLMRVHSFKAEPSLIPSAMQVAAVALEQAEALQDRRAISYAYGTLGSLYERAGDAVQSQDINQAQTSWTHAETYTQSALGLAQSVQASDIAYQWEWQLGRLYHKQNKSEQAIAYYKAAVESLKAVRGDLLSIDSEVQFSFRDNVEPVYRELVELLLAPEGSAEPTQIYLQQAVQQIDSLRLSELENFLRCSLSPRIELVNEEVDPTAAVVYPIILPNQLAVILKLPRSEQLYLHTISASKQELDQTFVNLRRALELPYLSPDGLNLARQTYDWLIRPIRATLDGSDVKTLVFVLDGSLRNVPMAALHDGQKFLIESYAIALSPGLKLLRPERSVRSKLDVLAFGLSEVQPSVDPGQSFPPLENVETELKEIRDQLPSQLFLNRAFTSTALRELITTRPVPIIHLATHGQFSSDPQETFILAWDRRIDINDLSNILQSREQRIANAIDLLVLSACKTADGDSRATLGLAGVAVQSGARSTLASLWYVNDRGTAELMGRFYRELAKTEGAVTKAEALRQAQLTLLQTPGFRAPLYWAPYVLVGNWL